MSKKQSICPAVVEKRPLGIYIHIPFCVRKCLYCDFLSMPGTNETIAHYIKALCRQIKTEAPAYTDRRVNTIFMGGGTPSLLSGVQLTEILQTVFEAFTVDADAEITMESNPGTLTAEKLCAYRKAGVNRLSMGLQSTENQLLKALGRIHTWEDFLENFYAARKAGFTNINIDLMSALPGQTLADWMETLRKAAELSPEHISAYSLIIEEGTPFYEWYGDRDDADGLGTNGQDADTDGTNGQLAASGRPALPPEDEERQMYAQTESFLNRKGYKRYEISNYAKEGFACRHNVGNWNRTDYLGFGIGAASLVDNRRFRVIADLERYLECCLSEAEDSAEGCLGEDILVGKLHEEIHALTTQEQMEEFMFLGLRLTDGISAKVFADTFGVPIEEVYGEVLKRLKKQELIVWDDQSQRISLTARGVDVSNYVLAEFLLEEEE